MANLLPSAGDSFSYPTPALPHIFSYFQRTLQHLDSYELRAYFHSPLELFVESHGDIATKRTRQNVAKLSKTKTEQTELTPGVPSNVDIIVDIVEHSLHEISALRAEQNFCKQVSEVPMSPGVTCQALLRCHCLANEMIAYGIRFLLQRRLWLRRIIDDRHVISIDQRRAADRHSHHS